MADKKNFDMRAYSYFVVIPNPRTHGVAGITTEEMQTLSNEEICKLLVEGFCNVKSKQAAALYCCSAGGLEHIHAVFSSHNQIRFSTLSKYLGKAVHISATRGSKEQVENYLNKTGKFAEKGEKILAKFQIGEIKGNQGQRTDIERIKSMIDDGMTWKEVRATDAKFYDNRYTTIIKNLYFDKRVNETPLKRNVNVQWIVGETNSGKTGTIFGLAEKYGENSIYIVSDYQNPFDGYAGEPIVILDEYRGQLPYATLLSMLEGYKKEIHCRYANVMSLWTQVYITTVRTPEQVYSKMISKEDAEEDPVSQLLGRITDFTYCYRVNRPDGTVIDRDGRPAEFYRYTVSGMEYRNIKGDKIAEIKKLAEKDYRAKHYKFGDECEAFGIKVVEEPIGLVGKPIPFEEMYPTIPHDVAREIIFDESKITEYLKLHPEYKATGMSYR